MQFHEDADLRPEDLRHERLRHVIDRAQVVAAAHVLFAAAQRGEENDRREARPLALPDERGGLEAVHLRHHDVEKDHGEVVIEQVAQRLPARLGLDHLLPQRLQNGARGEKILR